MRPTDQSTARIIEEMGWRRGTTFENRVALRLGRWGLGPPLTEQQHKVGRYRLDFAWPAISVALEADGWQHARPDLAVKDVDRDRWLRAHGWLVFRVDDHETLDDQLLRVTLIVKTMLNEPKRWRP